MNGWDLPVIFILGLRILGAGFTDIDNGLISFVIFTFLEVRGRPYLTLSE